MEYYVYEWFINDTLEIFYVGKGKGLRRFSLAGRNKYFMRIYNKYSCSVRIYKAYLTEYEAWAIEKDRIDELKGIGQAKTNLHSGGRGGNTIAYMDEEDILKRNNKIKKFLKDTNFCKGTNNPFYGKTHSDEFKRKQSRRMKERSLGELNNNSKPILLIDENDNVFMKLNCEKDVLKTEWFNNLPKPNSYKTFRRCKKSNKPFHGYKIVEAKQHD